MNHMKTFLTAIALTVGIATNLNAQDADRPTREDLNSDRLITELGLVGNQAVDVRTVNDRFAAELAAMKPGDKGMEQFKAERKALLDNRDVELKKLLTAEQWARLQSLRQQWRAGVAPKKEHQE